MAISKPIGNTLLIINITLAVLWIYQGLIPKLMYSALDEQRLWQLQGIGELKMLLLIEISGFLEIIFGVLFLIFRHSKILHYLNILGMVGLSLLIVITDIQYFQQVFNPFVMNIGMAMLSVIALQLNQLSHPSNHQL